MNFGSFMEISESRGEAYADSYVDVVASDKVKDMPTLERDRPLLGDVREYGLRECADAAKGIFTREVLAEWSDMSLWQREGIAKEYANALAHGLDVEFGGLVFEKMDGVLGYTNDSGKIYLNDVFLKDPSQVIELIDTVAHEARHLLQYEAIDNPQKFGIDQATVNEWKSGSDHYTHQYATVYDPWGYYYNPVEIDARYFGESIVRELTKDLINRNQQ